MSKIIHEVRDNPEKIWLEPGCSPERCWCENPLDDCEEPGCGAKAVGYVREDIVEHAAREVGNMAARIEQLEAALRDVHAAAGNNHLIANIARAALEEKA
jgi:hypothetical protein